MSRENIKDIVAYREEVLKEKLSEKVNDLETEKGTEYFLEVANRLGEYVYYSKYKEGIDLKVFTEDRVNEFEEVGRIIMEEEPTLEEEVVVINEIETIFLEEGHYFGMGRNEFSKEVGKICKLYSNDKDADIYDTLIEFTRDTSTIEDKKTKKHTK